MALLSRELVHFTGLLSLSRFHCHTIYFIKFNKPSAKTKQKQNCQRLLYMKASPIRIKPKHPFSNQKDI